jgi:hypothetical protein
MSEWIKWNGGECPVEKGVLVDVRYRDGDEKLGIPALVGVPGREATEYFWHDEGVGCDIVAYRLSETQKESVRQFDTGATRGAESGKLDYEGFLSPLVLERFAVYMDAHRTQADGNYRESDNWQKGMPKGSYIKSGWRHFMDWWKEHRGISTKEGLENAVCAVIFNAQGYLHEHLKKKAEREG